MLVRGLNDGPAHLRRLREAIERIRPDRVQINTVVRPPAERTARPLTAAELERVREYLGTDGRDHRRFLARQAGRPGAGRCRRHPDRAWKRGP